MGEMLSVKNINVFYGSIQALRDISFHVNEGEIVTLIGANGAGKTTTMHAISGLLKVQSGEIDYCGQNISKMEAHKIIRLGLAQVPEGRRVFSGLTVWQWWMRSSPRWAGAWILPPPWGRGPRSASRCRSTTPGRNTCTRKYNVIPYKTAKEKLCPMNFALPSAARP